MHSSDPTGFVLGKAEVIRQSKGRKMQSPTIHGHISEPLWRDLSEEENKEINVFLLQQIVPEHLLCSRPCAGSEVSTTMKRVALKLFLKVAHMRHLCNKKKKEKKKFMQYPEHTYMHTHMHIHVYIIYMYKIQNRKKILLRIHALPLLDAFCYFVF